ncbi:MAG: ABC transporter ATP-binding protein [Rhodothermia bacterium]|nr:MAG: ABC transporter ATP-binding protein [Rhodothermia bacterium]
MLKPSIRVTELAKEYRIGAREEPYRTLREALVKMMKAPIHRLQGRSREKHKRFWALEDINFAVDQGEVVGVIGRNGAGKSTLLKILSRITPPSKGQVELIGRVGSLLEVGTGFHPELTGRENIFLNGAILGMRRIEIAQRLDDIVAFAEIEEFLDTPIKRYSSGMHVRLAFSVAAHLQPEILLVDEVLSVGDNAFQRKCLGKVGEIAQGGRAIIFVSHQMSQIRRLCSRVIWLRDGRVEAEGSVPDVISRYEAHMSGRDAVGTAIGDCFLQWSFRDGRNVLSNVDDSVDICTELKISERIVGGHFGMVIVNDDGRIVAGWAFDDLSLSEGRRQLVLRLNGLPIKPGNYSLQFSLFNHGNNLNGGTVVEIWHALPQLIVDSEYYGHPQDQWAGTLNIKASLMNSS